jgi:formylglycine-generating enzyme required for sulfatase activity
LRRAPNNQYNSTKKQCPKRNVDGNKTIGYPSYVGCRHNSQIRARDGTMKDKTMFKPIKSYVLSGVVAGFTAANPGRAQTPPSLGLHLFAGININGATGSNYVIQSTMDLAQTNSWTSLAFVRLPATNFLFVDTTAPATGSRFYRALLQNPPTNMVFIPPNTFSQGTPTNEVNRSADEGPQTTVTISHGFWMGKYEVTQGEYLAVIGSNPSGFPGNLNRPVESVSWLDATNYCVKLAQQELTAGHIPPGSHYRLPTEAEWEYAARAGTSTRYSYGDDPNLTNLVNNAWYSANSGFGTHPVGLKTPNPWGLYDMEGNVWEWCQDWYGPYLGGFATDPQGPASNLQGVKVIRGGAWDAFEEDCRSGRRLTEGVSPFINDFNLGFRVVLVTEPL